MEVWREPERPLRRRAHSLNTASTEDTTDNKQRPSYLGPLHPQARSQGHPQAHSQGDPGRAHSLSTVRTEDTRQQNAHLTLVHLILKLALKVILKLTPTAPTTPTYLGATVVLALLIGLGRLGRSFAALGRSGLEDAAVALALALFIGLDRIGRSFAALSRSGLGDAAFCGSGLGDAAFCGRGLRKK